MPEKLDRALRKTYKLRRAQGEKKTTLEVTFPRLVVEREAHSLGLTVDEFIARYHAVAHFNAFEGVKYTFEEMPSESEEPERVASGSPEEG